MKEMRQTGGNGWRGTKPVKVNRRRILCPTLPQIDGSTAHCLSGNQPLQPTQTRRCQPRSSNTDACSEVLEVVVRLLYFSRDGNPADTGSAHEFSVPAYTTVDALLEMARKAAGVGPIGRLIFKGKPLTDGQMNLIDAGVSTDPKALHLMLARKFRPAGVAQAAALEAAALANAMAQAEAEFRARPRRERRRPADEEDYQLFSARSDGSMVAASSVGSAC